MPRDEELPIIRTFYDFMLWLNPKIAKFPRRRRTRRLKTTLGAIRQLKGLGV